MIDVHNNLIAIPDELQKRGVDRTIQVAKIAGAKFIQLLHSAITDEHDRAINGFQGAQIIFTGKNSGTKAGYHIKYTERVDGTSMKHSNGLRFCPEELSELLYAYTLDTPFNRDAMAKIILCPEREKPYSIVDDSIRREIEKMATERCYTHQSFVQPSVIIESKEAEILELKAKLEALEEKKATSQKVQESAVKVKVEDAVLFERAKVQIHDEERVWINDQIKEDMRQKKKADAVFTSPKYKKKILPLINKRLADLKQKELDRVN